MLSGCATNHILKTRSEDLQRRPSMFDSVPQFKCSVDEDAELKFTILMNEQTKFNGTLSQISPYLDKRKFLDKYASASHREISVNYSAEDAADKNGCNLILESSNFKILFESRNAVENQNYSYNLKGKLIDASSSEFALSCRVDSAVPFFFKNKGCSSAGAPVIR